MLAVDLFEFLGSFLVVFLLVQQKDALIVELIGRHLGRVLFLIEQAESAAGPKRGHSQHDA
jgi:hypothetical protein